MKPPTEVTVNIMCLRRILNKLEIFIINSEIKKGTKDYEINEDIRSIRRKIYTEEQVCR